MIIELKEGQARIAFRVNDDGIVELADFSAKPGAVEMPYLAASEFGGFPMPPTPRQFLAAHVTGESSGNFHANKHDVGSVSQKWKYVCHKIEENDKGRLLTLTVKAPNGLKADYFMQLFKGLSTVRTWATLTNESDADMGLEYVSSFMYEGVGKDRTSSNYDALEFYIPRNGWANEAQWHRHDAVDLGLSHMPLEGHNLPNKGNNCFAYGSNDSWSTSKYLPMGMVKDPESGEIFYYEVDHSGAWSIEAGMGDGKNLYICLMGPNDEAFWWKNLHPGDSFTTVPAAFGVRMGGIDEAIGELTMYRRAIRRPNKDDEKLYVVFNDYMNCLFGDPTEEKEKAIIDRAAALGCEYYCLDCGWYDSGMWWDKVGEWKESPERFPNGLKVVYDYARSKGLRMGMWLEIEAMGTACPLADKLPDDWFVMVHGKRRIEANRYLLDFRNPEVRKYCSDVVDRLIADYGCEFFKIDYNVTTGPGSELNADSRGDAMLEHCRAVYEWIRSVYAKHPDLVIENCCSGAQRMDYGMLSLHSLQSTSDQTDYVSNAYIAANVASAVTPEQGGMWVYPYENDREHIIFNMVNGLLLRPYVSGIVWDMTDESMAILREGITCYKAIRGDLKDMLPFFPLGFGRVNDRQLAYGVKNDEKAYLSVFAIKSAAARIPLSGLNRDIAGVRAIYPASVDCDFTLDGDTLEVRMPQDTCARLFEITFA
ncbi:MAG: alpha-galactosidase [Clostridiales bacterium]|nr:alpha-galactosidase [Clostridiales bacterium]